MGGSLRPSPPRTLKRPGDERAHRPTRSESGPARPRARWVALLEPVVDEDADLRYCVDTLIRVAGGLETMRAGTAPSRSRGAARRRTPLSTRRPRIEQEPG